MLILFLFLLAVNKNHINNFGNPIDNPNRQQYMDLDLDSQDSTSLVCTNDDIHQQAQVPAQYQDQEQEQEQNLNDESRLPQTPKFEDFVIDNQISIETARKLISVITNTTVVLLCDDSGSMRTVIRDPITGVNTTRWLEMKRMVSIIVNIVASISHEGTSIYFLNQPQLLQIHNPSELEESFSKEPFGSTPLITTLKKIYEKKAEITDHKKMLIVVITDGEPSDGNNRTLYNTLINKDKDIHISFAKCTDKTEDMKYLDNWDGLIIDFDTTDDFRDELARVKALKGDKFKYDYVDYVIKILLATFDRWYFDMSQQKNNHKRSGTCCNIV